MFWVGVAAIAVEVGVVALVCQRHRLGPLIATVTGWSLAAGYVLVHFLPARGWLSDSFISADGVSRSSALHPHLEQQPLRRGMTHPVALTMIVGNAVILVATAAS